MRGAGVRYARSSFQPESVLIEAYAPRISTTSNCKLHRSYSAKKWEPGGQSGELERMYEVRLFLDDKGVESKKIALAIEELSLKRRVQVNCRAQTVAA